MQEWAVGGVLRQPPIHGSTFRWPEELHASVDDVHEALGRQRERVDLTLDREAASCILDLVVDRHATNVDVRLRRDRRNLVRTHDRREQRFTDLTALLSRRSVYCSKMSKRL